MSEVYIEFMDGPLAQQLRPVPSASDVVRVVMAPDDDGNCCIVTYHRWGRGIAGERYFWAQDQT